MLKRALLCMIVCVSVMSLPAQTAKSKVQTPTISTDGYAISATITPLKNCWLHMGCYYGKNKNMVDSAWVDENSKMVFKKKEKLPSGIYFIFIQNKNILFEFLVDDKQVFNMVADTAHLEKLTISGSSDNKIFKDYNDFLTEKIPQLKALESQLKSANTDDEKTKVRTALIAGNKELTAYRDKVIKEHPGCMMAIYFQYLKYPEAPQTTPLLSNGQVDSLFPWRYAKEHFWDNVAFNDDRLIYTPFFDTKIDEYFRYYVHPAPDSIIEEVNFILLSARTGKEVYKYLLGKFADKYINPEIMGQDKVFVFMFNQFFSKGDIELFNTAQKKIITDRAYSLMANQIGEPAPVLDLVDTTGKKRPMHSLSGPFTFLIFWDPNCGHCKEEIPRLDSIYNAKWHEIGVKIYAVNTDEKAIPAWKNYISEHRLNINGWTHVYQTKEERDAEAQAQRPNFRQLYDVHQTPTMYLLDKDKRIIAKKLTVGQFDELMQAKIKSSKN